MRIEPLADVTHLHPPLDRVCYDIAWHASVPNNYNHILPAVGKRSSMNHNRTPRRILSLVFVIASIAGLAACGIGGSSSLTVNDIISRAEAAHPNDATFTLKLAINGSASGTTINTTFTGDGT